MIQLFQQRMIVGLVLVVLLLAGCGGPAAGGTSAASADPEATVNQAIDALAAQDEATLTGMFDESVGTLRPIRAAEGVSAWLRIQSPAQVPGALGAVQSRQMQPAEVHGKTTLIPVVVTHARGVSRWEFSLVATDQGWRLVNIHSQAMEQRMP